MKHTSTTRLPRTCRCRLWASFLVVLSTGTILAASGCDTNAIFNPKNVLFQDLQVVSTFPAVRNGDVWQRQCGAGVVDGYLLDVVMVSTERVLDQEGSGGSDLDRSIRPGDVIDARRVGGSRDSDIKLETPGNYDVKVDCIDERLEWNDSSPCSGTEPSVSLEDVGWHEFAAERRIGHNVVFVIDQSGSMLGLVDRDTFVEADPAKIGNRIPPQLQEAASDFTFIRLTAVKTFLQQLNSEDRVGIMAFGEGLAGDGIYVPCALPEVAGQAWDIKLQECFPAKRDYWTDPTAGIDSLQSQPAQGRAPLWKAVAEAYDFLRELDDKKRTNHIIVLTDGPDTAAATYNLGQCQNPFSQFKHTDIIEKLETDAANPNAADIHIHFVQFESKGYPGPDALQMEVACQSGGQYQYINSTELSAVSTSIFKATLDAAIANVRHSLMGYWELAVNDQTFKSPSGPPTGTPKGRLYAMRGRLELKSSSNLVKRDFWTTFTGGREDRAAYDGKVVPIRKACGTAQDCGAGADAGDACTIICSEDTLLCPGGADGEQAKNQSACVDEGGTDGFCCDGVCNPAGSCESCCQNDDDCNGSKCNKATGQCVDA